ncbi:MAG TPA: DUF1707 domain-containing protein [Pseudonocardiaceae bacterium]
MGRVSGGRPTAADRARLLRRLHAAYETGLIGLDELDSGVRTAWRADTRAELLEVAENLPDTEELQRARQRLRMARAARVVGWLGAFSSVVNTALWLALRSTGRRRLHPWWVWVTLSWGSVYGVLRALAAGRFSRR